MGVMRRDSEFLAQCIELAGDSPDPSTQVGAIVVGPDREIIGKGINDWACGHSGNRGWIENKQFYMEHAERNALFQAVRAGFWRKIGWSTLYAPWSACAECARVISSFGVKRLVRYKPMMDSELGAVWRSSIVAGDEIMKLNGVEIIEVNGSLPVPDGVHHTLFRGEKWLW